ncbi:uncharacterized protein [Lolium perenne]|uniref:uncharacterized protein n=1 Tax=Lolium perenne TaxID=4522 RepID=UPI0021F52960|nr:uncharacterized protein LOC127344985 isoform X5 [Lolium perenne]XP_051227334.1 uncharacterized protein LOC127344985 isoform X5 [Lolium perenne]
MARSLGVKLAPTMVADITGLGTFAIVFNVLSVIIDIVPLCVLLISSDWREAKKFFTEQGFAIGAVMNLMLMAYVQFVADDQHPDVFLVSAVGFILGTAYTFFLLAHRVVTADRVRMARFWMAVVLISFLIACTGLLSGILKHHRSNGHGIFGVLFVALAALNGFTLYPIITCKPFPDQQTRVHAWCMCFLNLVDSLFFVFYAKALQSADGVLSLVSTINAACGVVQLIALAVPVFLRWLRKVGAYLRSCGESCGGCFRLIATLLDLHGE